MRVAIFAHSWRSCWNHGNAHFLRGVARELIALGHEVVAVEPADGWSCANLVADHGPEAVREFSRAYPELRVTSYESSDDVEALLDGAELILVHEWNDPALVARLGRAPRRGVLLFHDTHHRAVSDAEAMRAFDLGRYDGVLAFGATLAEIYRHWGWGDRAFIWHEAADTRLFCPPATQRQRSGLVWIGNWGDGERSAELRDYLLKPAQAEALPLDVYGVRYPADALAMLANHGARYRGWLANIRVPEIFADHLATVHVPRRYYTSMLPGIPTIRVFEALACGIPLLCAPWRDTEQLFRPGDDYLEAADGEQMRRQLRAIIHEPALRAHLASCGLETVRARHTCRHRAQELLAIAGKLMAAAPAEVA